VLLTGQLPYSKSKMQLTTSGALCVRCAHSQCVVVFKQLFCAAATGCNLRVVHVALTFRSLFVPPAWRGAEVFYETPTDQNLIGSQIFVCEQRSSTKKVQQEQQAARGARLTAPPRTARLLLHSTKT